RHMVSAGHYLAAHAGFEILESGGNAIDAGCAAGIALGVLQSDLVNVAGVAPIIIYHAQSDKVITISGLGTWPKRIDPAIFEEKYSGSIPENILRTVVPAAPDAWITALELYGTKTFSDVASAAIRFATDGFTMYPLMASLIEENSSNFQRWKSTADVYLPDGKPPEVGRLFIQSDLGKTLQYMVDEERGARGDRKVGLNAARDAFYKGDIAQAIVKYHKDNGGYLRGDDLEEFRVGLEEPIEINYKGTNIYTCGPWCQGPVLQQILKLLENFDLTSLGHNSTDYVHTLVEAIKLAFADRHFYYGDPKFNDVPMGSLLSTAYTDRRRQLIKPNEAWPGMPPAGDPYQDSAYGPRLEYEAGDDGNPVTSLDTSYVCVTDQHGNIFSSTPSDVAKDSPIIPGTGLCPSSRGSQSWTDPKHPCSVEPGKRPRLTPNPALAIRKNEFAIPFGTPGGDVQVQAMLQCLLNIIEWNMDPQQSVEAPRFGSYSFPDSFEPHAYHPGKLMIESRFSEDTFTELNRLGHLTEFWPEWTWRAGAVCMIKSDMVTGIQTAGADPRRPTYAVGW
ncbi:MAG TPA: gamma-glutamyltransferase family protein, partial [Rhodospirillales bacterium]|nr:gamma-glutamyltransferase family protein [Rhodospirillales bacterium]